MDNSTLNKQDIKAGDIIMRQGEIGEKAFIIEEGKVEILVEKGPGLIHRVGTRGPGSLIGEMSIVDDEPRVATIKAMTDCKLLEISRQDFHRRLQNSDPVIQTFMQVILTRFRDTLVRAAILKESEGFPTPEELERGYLEQTNAAEAIRIANDFEKAMNNDELFLVYQPIVDLTTGEPTGFEALMRWNHPEHGLISPAVFIPVAEETGLIVDASRWALRESCKALKRMQGASGYSEKLFMSVNFSSTDFAESNFLDQLYTILSETDVPPSLVHLEITERLLMNQPENARNTLNLCRKAGLGISIDDFGTGYSSLSYLHYYPIDTLKIDQSFVRGMTGDKTAMELVRSIVALSNNMGMKTIAEGVESKEEALILKDMGCVQAQGYYFAKPMEEDNIIKALKSWDKTMVSP